MGQPTPLRGLEITGPSNTKFTIQVTQSALAAIEDSLQHYPRGSTLFLWIDQICIDQSSESEKIEQIRMMKDIYANADMVFAWLGYGSEDSDVGMAKIFRLFNSMKSRQYLPINGAAVELADFESVLGSADDPANIQGWQAILSILRRPYFSRGWILQEVTAVDFKFTVLVCGSKAVPLAAFSRVHGLLSTLDMLRIGSKIPSFHFLLGNSGWFNAIAGFQHLRERKDGQQLALLARRLRNCDVTDPKDRLACMLSFATDIHDTHLPFQIDYSLSFQYNYKRFAMWSICKYSNLDILSDVAGTHLQNPRLPSWVPDWSVRPSSTPLRNRRTEDDLQSTPLFAASGKYSSDVKVQLPLPSSPTILNVSGIYLSILHQTIPLLGHENGREYWKDLDFDRFFCSLNNCSMGEVFERTRFTDISARFDESEKTMVYDRRGGVARPEDAEDAFEVDLVSNTCHGRVLFLVRAPEDHESLLMGIGPENIEPGDQIWMIKGGKMLYILRPSELGTSVREVVFDATGGPHGVRHLGPEVIRFELIGEVFMLGLMDGEILDMMGKNPKRKPPPQFKNTEDDFWSIYLV